MQLNGLRILSLIPGIIEQLPGRVVEEAANLSIVPTEEGVLCRSSFPAMVRKRYGFGMMGVHRPRFLALLASTAAAHGIPIHYNMSVVHVTQSDQCATVHFDNGQCDSASFVVGCDGLHSVVRTALFGRDAPTFTGLTQVGSVCS
ncbi:unnamed protein product [Mycena citricolor]|uniref:FAD-binding domain-containing protein n=1 Tax=Mycena citricolor TaxID=2018698 RepID=A0AAD2HNY5_9AGAR|nr:unnamed protein product [Mycena citricolor]